MPILLLSGIGAMIDFGPLLSQPVLFCSGQRPSLKSLPLSSLRVLWEAFDLEGCRLHRHHWSCDGPTSILVSQVLGSRYINPIAAVAAYSYMALVLHCQPFAIRPGDHQKGALIFIWSAIPRVE